MRRLSLGTLLTGVNVGLVAATVVCVVVAAAGLLRRLADERALAHVGLAGSSAVRSIERSAEDLLISAHLLAERPTLTSLIQERDAPALADLLRRFRRTSHLSGCAVLQQGKLLARDGMLPWEEIVRLPRDLDLSSFALRPSAGGPLLLGAWSSIPSVPHGNVVVALVLDDAFAAATGKQVGLPVKILDRQQALAEAPQAALRGRALDVEGPVAERLDEAGLYLAVVPLRAPTGEVIGVVETELPTTNLISSQRHFLRSLLLIALGVGGLAVLFSVVVGRRLVRPLVALTDDSARIGLGDLSTPIPRTPGTEIGALAATMEEMRGRLLHLTAKLRRRQAEAEAEAILTGIVEGVFSVDRERRIRYLNSQAAAILGVRPEQAIGRFCGDVLNPQGPGGVRPCEERCPIIHARFRGRARATEDLLLSSGVRRSVVITSAPADTDRNGDPAAAGSQVDGVRQFQVMRDETDIEATRRLRDTVLANITHEFRTPLTAQLASIELLRDRLGELKAEDARDLILSLERGTLRLTQLIDNLLESVRIDAGHDSIRRQPVALEDVVAEAVDLARPLLALREQKLNIDVPFPLPSVSGDTPRLVQVFVNLLANANKFAPPGSTISIGGEVRDPEVALWVEQPAPPVGARARRNPGPADESRDPTAAAPAGERRPYPAAREADVARLGLPRDGGPPAPEAARSSPAAENRGGSRQPALPPHGERRRVRAPPHAREGVVRSGRWARIPAALTSPSLGGIS